MWSRVINRPSVIQVYFSSLKTTLNSNNSVIAISFEEFDTQLGYPTSYKHEEIPCACEGLSSTYCIRHETFSLPAVTIHVNQSQSSPLKCYIPIFKTASVATSTAKLHVRIVDIKK